MMARAGVRAAHGMPVRTGWPVCCRCGGPTDARYAQPVMLDPIVDRRNQQAGSVMGLGDHLEELRSRVVYALLGLVPLFAAALALGRPLLSVIIEPALEALESQNQARRLQVTSALESLTSYFYIAALSTLVVGGPWVIYQLWRFVAPGLYAHERRFAYLLAPLSVVLTIAGVALLYYVALPVALRFLVGFAGDIGSTGAVTALAPDPALVLPTVPVLPGDPPAPPPGAFWINSTTNELRFAFPSVPTPPTIAPPPAPADAAADAVGAVGATGVGGVGGVGVPTTIRALPILGATSIAVQLKLEQYIDLFVNLTAVFAVSFQLPVVILLLGWAGIIEPATLGRYRRHATAAAVIVAAVATPTSDPISLLLLAVPLLALYELGGLLLRAFPVQRIAPKAANAAATAGRHGPDGDADGP
ncbi:MAG: hypothetical protein C0475_07280 [Planctomyces sp.]|nr:hypothetical protein [Planctomyces sp.]